MIVVDTSALAAILFDEPDAFVYAAALFRSRQTVIGAPTAFELHTVMIRRKGPSYTARADALLARARIEILPWASDHVALAIHALRTFGGGPANLNYGDCMTYAVASHLHVPLLYKGDDFAHTDVRSALQSGL